MALSSNPTKTRKIENAFRRENKLRFRKFNGAMKDGVRATQTDRISNVGEFTISEGEIDRLMRYMRTRAYQDIIGVNSVNNANSAVDVDQTDEWQKKYINASYARGLQSAQQQLRTAGVALSMSDFRDLKGVATDQAIAEMLVGTNALHGQTVRSLQTASLTSLVQATETMLAQMRRDIEFAKTQVDVKTVNVIKDLSGRISVANSAGEQIASTETIQAFQNAQINNAKIVGDESGEEVNVRWLTRNDSRVRHLHARWHGKIMTPIEASQNINESPWNCRCGFAQVPPVADTDKRQDMIDKERKQLLAEEG